MNRLVWITSATILFLVFVVPAILAQAVKVIPFNDQSGYSTDYKRGVYGKFIATQELTIQADSFTGIGLSLGNPNLKNKKDVILSIYDDSGTKVRESVLNGQNIADGAFVRFLFEPITSSKNQKYLFSLASPNAGDEEIINIFFTTDTPSWIGELMHDEETLEGGMPLVTYHAPVSKIEVVKNIYSFFAKRLFGLN